MSDNFNNIDHLSGQFLIATQSGAEHFFNKSLVLITEHSPLTGSVGYVLSKPFVSLNPKEIFKERDISFLNSDFQLLWGGPIDLGHGIVLHPDSYQTPETRLLENHLALTETQQILDDISAQAGPQQFLILVGKSVWDAGQLEEEIMGNLWIPAPCSTDLIFQTPHNKKWQEALATLNINANLLTDKAGKA